MTNLVSSADLDLLFRRARTHNKWMDKPVGPDLLRAVYDLARMGPTAANAQPARFVFVTSPAGKEKLKPALAAGNLEKTMSAPVTVIVGQDLAFYENLPRTFPHVDAKAWFVGNDAMIESTAFRNSSLSGAYLILAARSLGLDAGPMSGFDNAKVDQAFFAGTQIRSNFLVNLGYGDDTAMMPRLPRLEFDEACRIA
ncbi:malonic semialdehyde reductase [Telmatospirillum siberiense]|uniref:Putative NADH dehydrogenase/NAD(P)H nitroreductase CWS72_16915 n=1 Tax=Telmatospirillum siberiense TaxID=382514 RepID=A0A2N3PSD3_9PROT|nr:malonic semialdehyde reductase [Telmatospirillum siberiense]PKU23317.1 malonic semialdehyde reductase [Telmatospirillum siberiense]